MLLNKYTIVRVEFRFRASARAWQETNDLRNANEAHSTHDTAKLRKVPTLIVLLLSKTQL